MQGPEDEGAVPRQAVRTEDQLPPRPYGGKAMLRLLEMLESQGLTTLAQTAAGAATTDDVQADAVAHARTVGVLSAAAPARRRPARKRTAAADQEDAAAGGAEAAGDEGAAGALPRGHAAAGAATAGAPAPACAAAAADRTGPPTAGGPQWRSVGPWTVTNGQTYGS